MNLTLHQNNSTTVMLNNEFDITVVLVRLVSYWETSCKSDYYNKNMKVLIDVLA